MIKKLLLIVSIFIITQCYAQVNLGLISAQRIGDGYGGNDVGYCAKLDAVGNIYVIGTFEGMVDFDPSLLSSYLSTSLGAPTGPNNKDVFFAKYSPTGNLIWIKSIGSISDEDGNYLDISPNGNITIAGSFYGTVDFDPSPATANLTVPAPKFFLAQYDANGNYLWANAICYTSIAGFTGLNSDASGNLLVSGFFSSSNDFDPSAAVATLSPTTNAFSDVFIAKYDGSGNYLWAKNVGGTSYDQCNSQVVDNLGNLYITGTFSSTADFDPSTATSNLVSAGQKDIFMAKYDAAGNYLWAKSIGSANYEACGMITKDNAGNIYLTGVYTTSLDCDPSAAVATLTCSSSSIFIAKYDFNGNYLMCFNAFYTPSGPGMYSLEVDNFNNIFLAAVGSVIKFNSSGIFQTSTYYGPTSTFAPMQLLANSNNDILVIGSCTGVLTINSSTTTLNSLVGTSFFLINYSNSLNYNWGFVSRDCQSAGTEGGTSIKIDAAGNVFVAGTYGGIVDFDPSAASVIDSSKNGSPDIFLSKYNAAGNLLWNKTFGSKSADGGKVLLELDAAGNIYLAGNFSDTIDFDPSPATANLIANMASGSNRVFFAKYDNNANYIWAKAIDGYNNTGSDATANGIGVDASGNVYLAGQFQGVTDFDPSTNNIFQVSQAGYRDVFFAKYDATGNYVWAKKVGGYLYDDYGEGLKLDQTGNLILVGEFTSTCDFDPSPATATIASSGSGGASGFMAKYDPSGNYIWAKAIAGPSAFNNILSVALNSNDEIFITGVFSGTCDFDPSTAVANLYCNGGYYDIFIARYDAAGNYIWAKSISGPGIDQSYALCLDGNQNVYVTGYCTGTLDFDPSAATVNISTNAGTQDIFIAEYDQSGNYLFANTIGGAFNIEAGTAIAADPNNNVIFTGGFRGTADFDLGPSVNNLVSLADGVDIFIAKYASCSSAIPASSPSLTAISPSICINSNSNLIVSSGTLNAAANWQWYTNSCGGLSAGSGTSISVSPTTTTVFYARGEGPCVSAGPCATVAVNVNSLPIISIAGPSSVCVGSSANFTASGATTYTWNTNANTTTVNVLPSVTTTYSVNGTDGNNCVNTQTVTLNINTTCADVWPGDANSDGMADNLDILELGLHFTQTGAVRTPTSNNWQSYFANNWTGLITNGKNLNNSDCDGNGLIDQNDTLAIFNNYGFLHAFKETSQTVTNPQLYLVPDQNFVNKDTWGSASIYFGDSLNQINNVNGIAYTLAFDKNYIEQDSVYITYPASFLNLSNQNLNFRKRNFNNGVIYTASTHTNNLNVNGYGKIATFYFKVKASLNIDTAFNMNILQANQSSANGFIIPLTTGSASLMVIGASVNIKENLASTKISIFPNPTKNSLKINSSKEIQKVEILSITGQILLNETGKGNSMQFNLDLFANGTYFVKVHIANESPVQKIIIKN
ncbi:MAG: T9SS type A sorting domain-containing protein [Bacteroidetes bacterium]|nr:T9SS type A sorting domain-containing protein [Bacteroidota bacterium]